MFGDCATADEVFAPQVYLTVNSSAGDIRDIAIVVGSGTPSTHLAIAPSTHRSCRRDIWGLGRRPSSGHLLLPTPCATQPIFETAQPCMLQSLWPMRCGGRLALQQGGRLALQQGGRPVRVHRRVRAHAGTQQQARGGGNISPEFWVCHGPCRTGAVVSPPILRIREIVGGRGPCGGCHLFGLLGWLVCCPHASVIAQSDAALPLGPIVTGRHTVY